LLLLLYFASKLDVWKLGIVVIGIILCYILLDFGIFYKFGILFSTLKILIPMFTASIFILIFRMYESQVKIGVLEGSLKSYLSPHLMEKIKNNPDMLKLGGERKRISVLFSDIAGFTSFTDKADPEEVQSVLEEYFNEMTTIVFNNKGIVDKYMGDGIMAFFENPENGVTSAQYAVKTAVEMQNKANELDGKYKKQNRFPFAVYVGIATGYAKVGNIGPPEKVDYTVIGSVVNKASRLDGPGEPGDILMDEDTYFFVKNDYEIESFGSHELKGFDESVEIYRLSN
jgi:adenylate cyclase